MAGAEDSTNKTLSMLRHDINNQLSNIQLCLEELKHADPAEKDEYNFYIETIGAACKKITEILKKPDQ